MSGLHGTRIPQSKINRSLDRNRMIVNQLNPTQNVKTKKYHKGMVNKLDKETQSVSLHINSLFRDDYYNESPSDYNYTLPVNVENVLAARLTSVNIPNTWFLFESEKANNVFYIELYLVDPQTRKREINADGVPTSTKHIHEIVIPDGNYTSDELARFLNNTYFKDVAVGVAAPTLYQKRMKNIEFIIDPQSLKCSFNIVNQAEAFNFNLVFVTEQTKSLVQTAGWIMGFRNAKYNNVNKKVQSEGVYDGAGDRYLYMCLNDFTLNQTNNNIICLDKTFIDTHVLAKINIATGNWGIQIDDILDGADTHTKTRVYAGPTNLKKFNIKLLDMFGKPVNLNTMDWSFTLELEKLYQNII